MAGRDRVDRRRRGRPAEPSGEFRTKTFDWPPLAVLAAHTTCTPVASAVTADELKKRENVNPVGHANGPSPQSEAPLPLYWLESNCTIEATRAGGPKDTPPSVDFTSQMPRWWPLEPERWQAYFTDDELPQLAFYCPECAEREFGDA